MILHPHTTIEEPMGLCDPCSWRNFIHRLHPVKGITTQERRSKVLSQGEGRFISPRPGRGKHQCPGTHTT